MGFELLGLSCVGRGGNDEATIGEERRDCFGEGRARDAARRCKERRRLTPYDQLCVRIALDAASHTTRVGETRQTRERRWVQGAVHLERDEREGASAERDVGRDVRLVRIGRANNDEATLEVEQIARGQRAVRIDPEGGAGHRIVGEAQQSPRGEPCEAALTDRSLEPHERCATQLGELFGVALAVVLARDRRRHDRRRDGPGEPTHEIVPKLRERRFA